MRGTFHNLLILFAFVAITACGSSGGDSGSTANSNAPTADGLVEVKAFVSDVRTWGNVISEEARVKNNTFQNQLEIAGNTYDLAGGDLLQALINAYYAARDAYLDGVSEMDLTTYFAAPIVATGTATVSGTSVSVVGIIDGQEINMDITMPNLNETTNMFTFVITGATAKNTYANIKVNSGSVKISYTENKNLLPWFNGTYPSDTFPEPEMIDLSLNASIAENVIVPTKLNPITFDGEITASLWLMHNADGSAYIDEFGYVGYNPDAIMLSGAFADTMSNMYFASFEATMANADSFLPDPAGTKLGETDTNYRDITLSLTLTETLLDLPTAQFTLSADRDGFKSGDVSVSIAYGEKKIDAVLHVDNVDTIKTDPTKGYSGSITITNNAGVQLVLTPSIDDDATALTYNGVTYGYINGSSNSVFIHYYNGDVESI